MFSTLIGVATAAVLPQFPFASLEYSPSKHATPVVINYEVKHAIPFIFPSTL